eukprot:8613192-Pyramimonas_sp.AAC.1
MRAHQPPLKKGNQRKGLLDCPRSLRPLALQWALPDPRGFFNPKSEGGRAPAKAQEQTFVQSQLARHSRLQGCRA